MLQMSRCRFALAALLSAVCCLSASAERYALVNVHVIPMDTERVLRDHSVIIEDGIISAVVEGSALAQGDYQRIDADGAYVLPGLAEMHAHVPGVLDRQYLADVLLLYVANGITTARGMLGQAPHLKLRERILRGEVTGPRLFTSGPSLNGNSVDGPDRAAAMVRQQAEQGYDFVKIHPGLSRAEYLAAAAAAKQAGIPWAGHVPADVGLKTALEAGQASVDHLDGYLEAAVDPSHGLPVQLGFFGFNVTDRVDVERLPELVHQTVSAGAWVVPTQSLLQHVMLADSPESLAARAENRYMPPRTVQGWANAKRQVIADPNYSTARAQRFIDLRRRLLKGLNEAGVLLLGSDAPQVFNVPGFSIHHELAALIAAGLTPYEALRTGTVNPAVFFDAEDQFGRVRQGLAADLIVVDGNPLEDLSVLRNPRGVVLRGEWLDRADLDAALEAIARRNAAGG